MWVSKKEYDDLKYSVACLEGYVERINSCVADLKNAGLLGKTTVIAQCGNSQECRYDPAYPIVENFKLLLDKLGYEVVEKPSSKVIQKKP